MIQILGVKRILVLIILLAANISLAAVVYLYLVPESDNMTRQLQETRAKIASERAETDRLRTEFQAIQEQKNRFETLQAAGFMSDQNRLVARRRIMDIQKYTKVLRAGYDISSANVVRDKAVEGIGYVILSTPVSVEIEALDDLDVYNFIYWMENAFPGHTSVQQISMARVLDVNEAVIRQIGSGVPTTLVKGTVDFLWQTIVPESSVQSLDGLNTGEVLDR